MTSSRSLSRTADHFLGCFSSIPFAAPQWRRAGGRRAAAEPHRFVPEPGANLIHCVLDPPRPIEFSVEQGRRVGREIFDESVRPDPDQPKPGNAVGLAGEQSSRGAKQGFRQLGRVGQPTGARARAKIGGLKLQGDRPASEGGLLQAS